VIGQTISHYRVLRQLGGGGMGVVYEAEDLNLNRHVAMKFISPGLANDTTALERFRREAHSASSLNHPNIVTIYEFGQCDSSYYIAMELVQGKTLRELFSSGVMPIRKIVQIATQVADGLAAAHEAGILHRDLKPENIVIAADCYVKILDFGLAKPVELRPEQTDSRRLC
jgi:serine/threonine protein kinase